MPSVLCPKCQTQMTSNDLKPFHKGKVGPCSHCGIALRWSRKNMKLSNLLLLGASLSWGLDAYLIGPEGSSNIALAILGQAFFVPSFILFVLMFVNRHLEAAHD